MKRLIFVMQLAAILAVVTLANAQVVGRFGFEYNEAEPWDHPKHELLLDKLAKVTGPGDINVNVLAGGWFGMQPRPSDPIDFTTTDAIIQRFGLHGFSLAWNLLPNAPWAYPNKSECQPDTILGIPIYTKHCAPAPEFEQHWINYISAIVERYDGDGVNDMPGLLHPVRAYIMTGEIKFGISGKGDQEKGPFWYDSIDNLLRMHRITYEAIHKADPSGHSKLISSGALLSDLYADFPDYPEFDPVASASVIQRRLRGENYRGSTYTAGWDSLKKMLASFAKDADGIECDYVGWHPHFNWRVIDQEFAFIHAYAGNKPIYVDDVWANLFAIGYAGIPGEALFTASRFPNRTWVKAINGDFPNTLFASNDPYAELFQKLNTDHRAALEWYYANGARRLLKSFVSAFGEGAIIVNFSGTNDLARGTPLVGRGWVGGWINLTGTYQEGYFEKPQYHTYKLLVEKLRDFTAVTEIPVSADPRTRVYEFDRPRGPVYVLWSETGEAPPNLDYRISTGETLTLKAKNNASALKLTHIITDTTNTVPEEETIPNQNGVFTLQLGYEPFFLEGGFLTGVDSPPSSPLPLSFELEQNYPNPFLSGAKSSALRGGNPETVIGYYLPGPSEVEISLFNLQGQKVTTLMRCHRDAGYHKMIWNGRDESGRVVASGVYLYQLKAGDFVAVKKMVVLRF
jgi:hypothetical protein